MYTHGHTHHTQAQTHMSTCTQSHTYMCTHARSHTCASMFAHTHTRVGPQEPSSGPGPGGRAGPGRPSRPELLSTGPHQSGLGERGHPCAVSWRPARRAADAGSLVTRRSPCSHTGPIPDGWRPGLLSRHHLPSAPPLAKVLPLRGQRDDVCPRLLDAG